MSAGEAIVRMVESELLSEHGAVLRQQVAEYEVDLASQASPFSAAGLIPAGACNVLVSGRVTEDITIVGLGDPATDIGLDSSSPSLISTDYFGSVDGSEGDTFTPADMDDPLSSGVGVPLVYGAAGDVTFTAGADFLTGKVRLAIFFQMVDAPTS